MAQYATHQYAKARLCIEDPAKPGSGEILRETSFNIEHLAKRLAPLHELFQQADNYLKYELKYTPCPDLGGSYTGNLRDFMDGKTYNLMYDEQWIGYDLFKHGQVGAHMLWSDDPAPKIYVKWKFKSDFEKQSTAPTYARHTNNGHYGF